MVAHIRRLRLAGGDGLIRCRARHVAKAPRATRLLFAESAFFDDAARSKSGGKVHVTVKLILQVMNMARVTALAMQKLREQIHGRRIEGVDRSRGLLSRNAIARARTTSRYGGHTSNSNNQRRAHVLAVINVPGYCYARSLGARV